MAMVVLHGVHVELRSAEGLAKPLRSLRLLQTPCERGRCGACMVRVLAGASALSPVTVIETATLKRLGRDSADFRLACQATVADNDAEFLLARA